MMPDFSLNDFPNFPDAECKYVDGDLFFPESQVEVQQVLPQLKRICGQCVHQTECLQYALENRIMDGIWGGQTPHARKAMLSGFKENRTYLEFQRLKDLGWSVREIADYHNIKVESVYRQLYRAKAKGLL